MEKLRSWSGMFSITSFLLSPVLLAGLSPKGVLASDRVSLVVFNPTGGRQVGELHAPRLDTLEGKTICEISNMGWEAIRTFPLIRELLKKQFPTIKIIPYTEFPMGTTSMDVDNITNLIKAKGCQAVITGNAG